MITTLYEEENRMRRKTLFGICALTMAMLCGCGAGQTNETAGEARTSAGQGSGETNKQEAGSGTDMDLGAPSGKRIVVVSNNLGGDREAWLKEKAEEAGFQVELVPLGAGDITARVISEVNNPTTNVVWGPSEDQFTSMVAANALVSFTPDWSEDVKGISKENGYSWPYEIQPKLLVCNPDVYTQETAPKNWSDLWEKEEFHGKYAVPVTFDGNTNRAVIGGILAQYLDPDGELGVSDEGWAAIKAYFDYGYKTPTGEDDFGNMASGKVPITFSYASGLKTKCESFDITPLVIYAENGDPTNTNQIGVVANTDEEAMAESKRFVNWIGSGEVIGAYAAANGNIVANAKAEDQMSPIAQEVKNSYTWQEADWTYINSMMDQWVAKIQLEIY